MELNLGSRAVFQLQETFHFVNSQFDCEGFLPVINISIEIARELYHLYIKSVHLQMKNQKQLLAKLNRQDRTSEFGFLRTSNFNVVLKDQKAKRQPQATSHINSRSKEFIELIIGAPALSQLETQFGNFDAFPQGFQPVIQVSLKLAEKLHSAYMQSVLLQKQNEEQILSAMAKQERKAAKKIRKQQQSKTKTPDHAKEEKKTNNLVESTFKQDKTNSLVVQKLITAYPSVPKELIMELLMAFDYSYQEVFDALKASSVKIISAPNNNVKQSITHSGGNQARSHNIKKTAEKCRQEAQMYLEKQQEQNLKAKQAHQQKNFYVAQHYSETARNYRNLYEEANKMAITLLMEEEDVKHSNILDLHHFNVKEAMQSLNIYIDAKINLLKKSKQRMKKLSIIIGRGKHSAGKRSKLGPAVEDLLRRRNIPFTQPAFNSGMLEIKVYSNTLLFHS